MSRARSDAGSEKVLSQRIADSLREAILRGSYRPGERIRQEDIAAQFSASRFPVREAFRILESAGLVTVRANHGARVNVLTQAECVELYKVRERLESLLIRDSVPGLDESAITRLGVLLEELSQAESMSVDEYVDLDRQFHALTYSGSSMETVRSLVERLLATTNYYRRAYRDLVHQSSGRDWILQYDHELIVDAIRRGDAEEASTVMRLHTRRARLALEQHPEIFATDATPDRTPTNLL